MATFEEWDAQFRAQNLFAFNNNSDGLLWLKVRSLCRGKLLERFQSEKQIELASEKISDQNKELFSILQNRNDAKEMLDSFLRVESNNWYRTMGIDECQLKEDLYRIQQYNWGGDQNNSLDKYFVSRYVKVISKYDDLQNKSSEIASNAWQYVQTSWYNNWTSYLIESLFKRHPKVVSAVGEIKSVDFFIENNPIDLKVTYYPNQYMDKQLAGKLGKGELSWLKSKARENNISYDGTLPDSQLKYVLIEKLTEHGRQDVVKQLRDKQKEVILSSMQNAETLMKWLYENQGEMRFGAENRIFVILVDSTDISQSWKMKRAFSLIEPKVREYLDNFTNDSLKQIDFEFKHKQYHSLADIVFIIKE